MTQSHMHAPGSFDGTALMVENTAMLCPHYVMITKYVKLQVATTLTGSHTICLLTRWLLVKKKQTNVKVS